MTGAVTVEEAYRLVVLVFTVANLAAMGLEIDPSVSLASLRSARFVLLVLIWGWLVGPALAYLITRVLPLSPPHAAGLLLISLAPAAPFYPLMVRRAGGDMSSAGAFVLVTTIGTAVLLPLQAPFLIEGLAVDGWTLARPLVTLVLLPLGVGLGIRVLRATLADRLLPPVRRTGTLFLLITAAMTAWLYWREMVGAVGSYAPGALLVLLGAIAALSYRVAPGLDQGQRSAMALGMCTRNIAAVFVAYFGIRDPDPGIFVMIVLVVPLAPVVALVAARVFARGTARA